MARPMRLSTEEYKDLLKEFLRKQGPNRGSGFFGPWAWQSIKEKEFQAILMTQNIDWDTR